MKKKRNRLINENRTSPFFFLQWWSNTKPGLIHKASLVTIRLWGRIIGRSFSVSNNKRPTRAGKQSSVHTIETGEIFVSLSQVTLWWGLQKKGMDEASALPSLLHCCGFHIFSDPVDPWQRGSTDSSKGGEGKNGEKWSVVQTAITHFSGGGEENREGLKKARCWSLHRGVLLSKNSSLSAPVSRCAEMDSATRCQNPWMQN